VLTAAWLEGAPAGGLPGLLLGLGLDAAGGTPGACALALGCAGALGGFAGGRSRLLTALGCVLGNAAAAFWGADSLLRTGLLYEFFIASVLFLLPPERVFENARRWSPAGESGGLLHYLQGRTGLAAAAFGELHALLAETPVSGRNDEDVLSAFDAAAEETCRSCRKREECWGVDYQATRSALQAAWQSMDSGGAASPEDFPLWFRDRCLNIRGYAAAVGRERKELLRRRQMKQRLRADRDLLERQYADFAAALRDLAALSRGSAREEAGTAKRLRLFLRDYAPGTLVSAFRDGNGRLHVELEGVGKAALLGKEDWLDELSVAAGVELSCPDTRTERLHLYEKEPLEAEVGVAACCRGGKSPSGDVARSFKTAEGILYLLVADGMGSGAEAAGDSEAAANLAEKLLRAGIAPETVMRLLNTALLLRSEKRIGSLSLDLLSVNLFSGEACVYKYGAAPSYVRSGGRVRLIRGESAAAGTEDRGPDCTRLQLDSGSAAVILTDGAARAEHVEDKLLRSSPAELRELAGNILAEAGTQGGWEDDMTVLTLSLLKRGEPGIS
jgi:stage II sporulation protein E